MSRFYTDFTMDWDHLLLGYYEDGVKKNKRIKLKPYLFIPSSLEKADYQTYDNKPVIKVDFESVKEAREFTKSYEGVPNFKIYGTPLYHYVYIYENFRHQQVNRSLIKVLNFDIETDSVDGYPTHNMADREINAITMKIFGDKSVYVLGYSDYDPHNLKRPEPEIQKLLDAGYKIYYKKCKDEKQLLESFINIWEKLEPDVVSGWNIKFFDIPYVIKRISYILGEEAAKRLSPFRKIKSDIVTMYNKENDIFDIVGVPTLDYIDLYRKFNLGVEESYSLNYLSNKILKATKLDYSEYGSLAKLQVQNPEKYISYNLIDVIRVEQIDEKVKFMDVALEIAYETLTNFTDSMTTIRVWDALIHNYLMDRKKVVPHKSENRKDRSIAGGFVKEPQIGKHKWVMSFDFKSLYPHLCMTYNISPDAYLGTLKDIFGVTSVEKILAGDLDKRLDIIKNQDVCVTGAGTVFSKKKKGFVTEIMENLFDIRAKHQKQEDHFAKIAASTKDNEAKIKSEIFANKSTAYKYILNGGYGAFSNEWYRFFHNNIAESFTLSGQLAIKTVSNKVNHRLNQYLNTHDVDYIIAIDTDSQYISMDEVINRFCNENPVDFLEKFSETVQSWIQEGLEELYDKTNAFQKKLYMNLEAIGPAIWVAKKRYVMSLPSFKKIRFNPPKIKMMGIEAVRSTTPLIAREWITNAIPLALDGEDNKIKQFIDDKWNDFIKKKFEDIAMPKGTNDLEKYMNKNTIYGERTPLHIRGALLFNHYVKEKEMEKEISLIQSGDKVKTVYLKLPNPLMENALSIPESLPGFMEEFAEYIDHEKQFNKIFLDALRRITDAAGIDLNSNLKMDGFYE